MDILIKNMELPKTENDNFMVIVTPTGVIDVVENGNGFMMQKKYEAVALPEHGDLIDRGLVQEVLAQLLPLVITNELTDKEIGLVHRTVGAIAEMINEQEVVVEATE